MRILLALIATISLSSPVAYSTPIEWEMRHEVWNDPCASTGPCVVTVCDSIKFCRQQRVRKQRSDVVGEGGLTRCCAAPENAFDARHKGRHILFGPAVSGANAGAKREFIIDLFGDR